ncbi:MAG: hypothetical protein KDD34_03550, partial [Bdellovibrionales bacterium]|nr:hypothetical protein [Bdellovibrionales bacterium]
MARLKLGIKIFLQTLIALSFVLGFAACSKKDKGTKIRDRQNQGAGTGQAGDTADTSEDGSKATHSGAGSASPNGGEQQKFEPPYGEGVDNNKDTSDSTKLSELGIYTDETLFEANNESSSFPQNVKLPEYYDYIRLEAPDYNYVHTRANDKDYDAIITKAKDPNGDFEFTDYKDDFALNTVIQRSVLQGEELVNPEFVELSKTFAANIRDVRAHFIPYNTGSMSYTVANVKVTYHDGSTDLKTLELMGYINVNGQAALGPMVPIGQKAEHNFQGYITCLDNDPRPDSCQSSILVIEQVQNKTICKRIFTVLRHTNAAIRISRDEYNNYLTEKNFYKSRILNYVSNTIVAHRLDNGVLRPDDNDLVRVFGYDDKDYYYKGQYQYAKLPMPYMGQITARTFSVAWGYSEIELLMTESDYSTLQLDEMRKPQLRDGRRDVLRVVGPLAKVSKENEENKVVASLEVDGFIRDQNGAWVAPESNEPIAASLIDSA